jgi:hypothetical protein
MADDKRKGPDQPQQGDNQPNRQRDKDRRPGGGNIDDSPDRDRPRREGENEPQR